MLLHPEPIGEIPEETVRVAKAAFTKGNLYMMMRDELGTFYQDEDFASLFPTRGQPVESPWRLALVSVIAIRRRLERPASHGSGSRPD
jgi:transposase